MKKSVATPGNQGTVRDNSSQAQVVTHVASYPVYARCQYGSCKKVVANRKYCTRHEQIDAAKCANCNRRRITTPQSSYCNRCMADIDKKLDADQARWDELSDEEKHAQALEVFATLERNHRDEWGIQR